MGTVIELCNDLKWLPTFVYADSNMATPLPNTRDFRFATLTAGYWYVGTISKVM